jgi:hypothetical protein
MGANGFWGMITGEMSKLRNYLSNFGIKITSVYNSWKLDSSQVNYELARALYDNTDDRYKLGAGFCKRIINAKAGFIGVPKFNSTDPEAQDALDAFFNDNISQRGQTMKKMLVEGRCIVWITREETDAVLYPESKAHLVYNIIPNESLKGIIRDPVTLQPVEYVFAFTQEWYDKEGNKKTTYIQEHVTAAGRRRQQSGDLIPDFQEELETNWGFIPIIIFNNEADVTRESGQSEFEPVEPYLKAYHDLMFRALQGSHMHSTPRMKLKVKDVASFLLYNFGIADARKFAEEGGKIKLDNHELLILQDGEDAHYIEIQSPAGGAEALLKLLFYCIVDASETPEFVFGVHTPSALSSVKEQMPVFGKTIDRKRDNVADSWKRLARIVLAMTALSQGKHFATYATTLEWEEIAARDDKEVAETIKAIVEALNTAIEGKFCSVEAATAFLQKYIPTMRDYNPEEAPDRTERERIIGNAIERERLADGALNLEEKKALETEIAV